MKNRIKMMSEEKVDDVIKSIRGAVQIPSVRNLEDVADGAAFGKDVRKALDYVMHLAESFGMRTFIDPDGYYGYAEIGPKDAKEMIGIVGHVDVVPEGDHNQWTEAEPFSGTVVDGKLIGRGSLDDKGPVIINLYAMKNLLDLGIELPKRVRLIVGSAEETTWECIERYVAREESPTMSYSPDADFPLINAEKTIVQMDAYADTDVTFEVEAMGAYNAVPGIATYTGSRVDDIATELDKLEYKYNKVTDNQLDVIGKGAHAMANHLGVNAIVRLAEAMYNVGERNEVIDFLAEQVKETTGGEIFQGLVKEEISGYLKFTVSRIKISEGKQYIGMDTRIPVLSDVDEIMNKYKDVIQKYNLTYDEGKRQEKLYVAEDSFLVQTLLNVYKNVMDEPEAKPLTTGGGTYARAFDNCVAFGCVFESRNMIDNMHQPDECFEIKFIEPALEIYTSALVQLLKGQS